MRRSRSIGQRRGRERRWTSPKQSTTRSRRIPSHAVCSIWSMPNRWSRALVHPPVSECIGGPRIAVATSTPRGPLRQKYVCDTYPPDRSRSTPATISGAVNTTNKSSPIDPCSRIGFHAERSEPRVAVMRVRATIQASNQMPAIDDGLRARCAVMWMPPTSKAMPPVTQMPAATAAATPATARRVRSKRGCRVTGQPIRRSQAVRASQTSAKRPA